MNRKLRNAIFKASNLRTIIVLAVVVLLRAWRIIPTLKPIQLVIPITLLQIIVFVVAAFHVNNFIMIVGIGNIAIVGLAMFPSTFQKTKEPLGQ